MASYFQQNLNLLCKYNPAAKQNKQYYFQFASYDEKNNSIVKKEGKLYFQEEGKYYQLYSENPKEEAKWLTKGVEKTKEQIFILCGMANIELLRRLLVETYPDTKIVVLEPNRDVLAYCMNFYNLREFITSPKFVFFLGDDKLITQMINAYFSSSWVNLSKNMAAAALPNYHVYKKYFTDHFLKIVNRINYLFSCLGNSLDDMLFGLKNHYLNIDACIEANSYQEVKEKYKGYPAIVVASGPSLDKNIQYLKQAQGKALILSCDASYVTCINNGVLPDAIVSLERGEPTYEYFYKGQEFHKGLVLVGPSLLWPKIHEEFPWKQLLFAKNHIGTEGWWSRNFDNIEFLNMGHSCATAAYGFARELGCDPVILIGQDLAYTDDKKHSSTVHDTVFTAEGSNDIKETEQGLGHKADLWTEDIYGNPIKTSAVFNLFRSYFETCISNTLWWTLIDATEGGAKIEGSVVMTFQEAIKKYCNKEIGFTLNDLLEEKQVSKKDRIEKYNQMILLAEDALEKLKHVKEMAVDHYKEILKYSEFDFEKATYEELYNIVLMMQNGNKIIEYLDGEGQDIRSYYQQVMKQTVIRVKSLGNELNSETVQKNLKIQHHFMHLLEVATVATMQVMMDMVDFINGKKEKLLEGVE